MKWIGTQTIYDHVRLVKGITLDSVSVTTIQSSGESFVDNDTSLMTSASIADKIEAYGYSTTAGDITGVTAGTGLSGGGTTGAVTLNVDASISEITTLAGVTAMGTASNTLVVTNDIVRFDSANANDPLVLIKNAANDATSGRLRFLNERGADGQDGDETGIIEFFSYDDGTPDGERYARIMGTIHDATATEESGKLILQVASHDGGDEDGLVLTGGSVDAEVDVTIGRGASSVTTIQGKLTMGSTPAMGNTGLLIVGAQTGITAAANLVTVGTIGTGTWQGSRVESAYLSTDTAHLTTDQTFTGSKTFSNDTTTLTSGNANDPLLLITNTADDATSGRIRFLTNRGADGEDNDSSGMIQFWSYDDGTPSAQQYGRIQTLIDDATSGQESGKMILDVASHDGGVEAGLTLTGGSVDAEVDVIVGAGAASVTTVAGTLTMGSTASMTNAGLLAVANQSNITGLGTISSGVWEGTAIATDQQKHVMHYQLAGYGQGDGTNYETTQNLHDNNAPFEHNINVGSDGLTAITVANMSRTGGHIMPRACTLKRWTGWGTCAGSQTAYIGLFKVSFTRDDNTNLSLVLLDEFSYTAMGNNKMESFDETSFTATALAAGDMIITAVKSQSGFTQYFNSTVEVEF